MDKRTVRRVLQRARRVAPVALAGGVFATSAITISTTEPSRAFQSASPTHYLDASVAPKSAANSSSFPRKAGPELADIDNSRVSKWVTRFTTSLRDDFSKYLDRMSKYAPMISKKLADRDMPQELVYLAMIESGFNPTAKSPVKATGLWQFMTATAQRYGLTVKGKVDERKDPAKATDAALSYLSDLYDRFGSWYLAAAAYNAGEGRVQRTLKQVAGKTKGTDQDYYRIANALPAETRDYVPKIVAAARIAKDPAEYGFTTSTGDAAD
jgi:membrane-bound lytic murein transglycosylase D